MSEINYHDINSAEDCEAYAKKAHARIKALEGVLRKLNDASIRYQIAVSEDFRGRESLADLEKTSREAKKLLKEM